MSSYYISKVAVSGPDKAISIIEFNRGVNLIYGASNTGKSKVIACIDYLLGSKAVPFDKDETGYDTVSITFENGSGETLNATRRIVAGESGPTCDKKVFVDSNIDGIISGEYRTTDNSYNAILLHLIGIYEAPQIVSSRKGKPRNLTFRSFMHQFFIREEDIFTTNTIIANPHYSNITLDVSALDYLLTGKKTDAETYVDPEIRKAKETAVIDYINEKILELSRKNAELEKDISEDESFDVEDRINTIITELNTVQESISKADEQVRLSIAEMYDLGNRLEEARFLQERYDNLHSQYEADLSRLEFIIDGNEKIGIRKGIERCPFCDHRLQAISNRASLMEVSTAEQERTKKQLTDLMVVEDELADEITNIENQLEEIKRQREASDSLLRTELRPKMIELQSLLAQYTKISTIRSEVNAMRKLSGSLSDDILQKESELDNYAKYNPKEQFNKELFEKLSHSFDSAISQCSYPNYTDAYISRETFDVVVNGRHKKQQGKGYRAFLNALFAFTLMKFMEENALYPVNMLVLDSPILSLKENDISEYESATESMKSGLFKYMIDNCGACQLIIVENELPSNLDYSNTTLIPFSKNSMYGRYGFLLDFRDHGDE